MLGNNPKRSFLGGAKIPNVSVPLSLDSIHASTLGATPPKSFHKSTSLFQSSHPRRVLRHFLKSVVSCILVSIHAPT